MDWINIKATDTWFFRDGRPFNAGEESWANSLFPPFPSVVYGTLRTIYFSHNMAKLPTAGTSADPSGDLRIRHLALHLGDVGTAFPIPADLIRPSAKNGEPPRPVQYLDLKKKQGLVSNYPNDCSHLLYSPFPEKAEELFGKAALSLDALKLYLDAIENVGLPIELKDYLLPEYKVGLSREWDTRHAEEGMLYKVSYRRPEGKAGDFKNARKPLSLSLGVEFNGLDLKIEDKNSIANFGADGKLAVLEKTNLSSDLPDIPTIEAGAIFKMYLATPALFSEGWAPLSLFEEYGLSLCVAALGRPQHIGGFDMANRRAKAMRKAVPAGSVYFLRDKKVGGKAAEFVEKFHGKALKGSKHIPEKLHRQGFGIVYFGKAQTEK